MALVKWSGRLRAEKQPCSSRWLGHDRVALLAELGMDAVADKMQEQAFLARARIGK